MVAFTSTLTGANQPLNITADGTYFVDVGGPLRTVGQFNTIYASGDFGGGTLTFYATPDGSDTNKQAIPSGALTATGMFNVAVKSRGYVAVLAGATNPNINLWVK